MEIVKENLALIKNNYINKNDIERKNTTNNNYTKSNKETENKIKKKKYTRRFKILRHCINQLKNNGISIDLFKFAHLIK